MRTPLLNAGLGNLKAFYRDNKIIMPQTDKRYKAAKQVTLIGAFINLALGFIKLFGGIFAHSHALFADGIHSFSDILTDITVLFASKYGSLDADDTHPYGHQRIETAATLLLALFLMFAGFGIAWDALLEVIHHQHDMPAWIALVIAFFSVLANEALFHYTRHVGEKIQSKLIIANAWHHRSDAGSSVIVCIGLIGSLAGLPALDAIAAIIVGLLIIKMGWTYGWNSVKELVDTAIETEKVKTIEELIQKVDGVQMIHQLRTRRMGHDILVDVHVLVAPYLSVSEGHYIAQHVHQTLHRAIPEIKDVTVHIDPEDDERFCPSLHLPSRHQLEQLFLNRWQEDYPLIEYCLLHYLDGKLSLDVFCAHDFNEWDALSQRIDNDLATMKHPIKARLYAQHSV